MSMNNIFTFDRAKTWLVGLDPIATGRRLRSKRLSHNLTQECLSYLLEEHGESVSKNAISTWETGKKTPTLNHVVVLSELYQCHIDELVLSYRRSRLEGEESRDQPSPFRFPALCNLHRVIFIYTMR